MQYKLKVLGKPNNQSELIHRSELIHFYVC